MSKHKLFGWLKALEPMIEDFMGVLGCMILIGSIFSVYFIGPLAVFPAVIGAAMTTARS